MKVEKVNHANLRDYLANTSIAGLFSRYVIERKPQECSLAVLDGSKIAGTAVGGIEFGLYEAHPYWVFASSQQAALLLAQALAGREISISFPLEYRAQFQEVFPGEQFTRDCLYVLTPSNFGELPAAYPITRLFSEQLKQLEIGEELKPFIGRVENWGPDTKLYGMVEGKRLLAIGEMMVQAGEVATLQQLYTLEAYRGQGLARSLVSHMAKILLAEGKLVTYLVSEDNAPSQKVAQSVGFELASVWGYKE